jgi:hypothetical protein
MRIAFGLPVLIAPLVNDEPRTAPSGKPPRATTKPPPLASTNAPVDSGSFPFLGVLPTESRPGDGVVAG